MEYVINGIFDHRAFREKAKEELKSRGWNYKVLASETGYSQGSIAVYMCGGNDSKFIPLAIATALGISLGETENGV